jgi:uncharacterized membrane protein YjgN (DUF898 family)
MDAFILYLIGGILTALTLTLYWPFFQMKKEKFWREKSWFGDVQFRFSGKGKDFFEKIYPCCYSHSAYAGSLFILVYADLKKYLWSHNHVGGATFHFPVTGKGYEVKGY